jgi:hypothetical protein
MALFKGSMLFQDHSQTLGWVENFYVDAASLPAALDSMQFIATVRSQSLSVQREIGFVRASANTPRIVPAPRRQRNADLKRVSIPGSFKPSQGAPDLTFVAAKLRYSDAGRSVFRVGLMRGLDDSLFDLGNDKNALVFFQQFLPVWQRTLTQASAFLLHILPDHSARVPVAIANVQYEGLTHRDTGRPLLLPRGRR